jgi:Selenophosphate synthase
LRSYFPQKHLLALIGLSNGKALANKLYFSNISKFNFKIKKFIDQKFIKKYKNLISKKSQNIIEENMICRGCAAKISQKSLKEILPKDIITHSKDASPIPNYSELLHSVDMINSIITDPFILGKISANHALSDIYASVSQPISAQMILQLPSSSENIQTRDLKQIYFGAKMIFDENNCKINGGHTMVGEDLHPTIGFSVIGKSHNKNTKKISHGDLVFLSGKIGSGLVFAGIHKDKIDSFYQKEVLTQMINGNLKIGKLLNKLNPLCSTDVTRIWSGKSFDKFN